MMRYLNSASRRLLPGVIGVLLASGVAFAAGSSVKTPPRASVPKAASTPVLLHTIKVNGQRIPLLVALQTVKSALKRPWSSAWQDRNLVVCRTPELTGTHFRTLRCETNAEHMHKLDMLQTDLVTDMAGAGGTIPANDMVDSLNTKVNVGALYALLAKLPPANSSYTLQVKYHGQIVEQYAFKKGRLVQVWRRSEPHGQQP